MTLKNNVPYKFIITLAVLSLLFIVGSFLLQKPVAPQALQGVLRPDAKLITEFELIDQKGNPVNQHLFKDKWSLVFFGYTSCPDICPTTLHILNSVMKLLGDKEEKLLRNTQVVFVSVDPERDSVEMLADYMAFFNKDFIAVTGDKKNIDNIARQFGAGYFMDEETEPGQYQVSHTSAIFLVTPDMGLVAAFSQPHIAGTIASQYEAIRDYLLK